MFVTQTYKYKKNGIIYVGGQIPEEAEILETLNILNAEDGFGLIRNSDGENMSSSVWLKDEDSEENYHEEKIDE